MIPLGDIPKIYLFRKIKVLLLFFGIVSLILENNNINFYWKNKYIIIIFQNTLCFYTGLSLSLHMKVNSLLFTFLKLFKNINLYHYIDE